MDATFIIASFSAWVSWMFPSLAEYTKYIGPILMGFVTGIGIFTNILPDPGHQYPVPDVTSLQAELQGSGGFILKIATFTRTTVVVANWFMATALYSGFYNTTNAVAGVLSKVKLAPKPAAKA
jgi:hypothetical protein